MSVSKNNKPTNFLSFTFSLQRRWSIESAFIKIIKKQLKLKLNFILNNLRDKIVLQLRDKKNNLYQYYNRIK